MFFSEFFEKLITGEGYFWDSHSREVFTRITETISTVNMARIRALKNDIRFPNGYTYNVHKFTGSKCISIGYFCSYIATSCSNSENLDSSLFMESESPEKGKEIISTRIAVDNYMRYFGIHVSRMPYFESICNSFRPF